MGRKPTDTVQLKLRFSEKLRRRLEREAKRHGTSLNTEIVNTLERAFQQSDNVIRTRAEVIAETLGDDIVNEIARLAAERDAATEREIFNSAMGDEPTSKEGSK